MLRQIFLRSRERAEAIKRDKYTCQSCGIKQSAKKGQVVKVQVHHKEEINDKWQDIIDLIYQYVLCDPEKLETLCYKCHDKKHHGL